MNKSFTLITLLILPVISHAELSSGPERDACFKNAKDIPAAYNCLSAKRETSNRVLDASINEANKRIKANNPGPFNGEEDSQQTSGDIYSQRFLDAQNAWRNYRDKLCLAVATELDEDSYDYHSYIDQCTINLNKNHAAEIKQIGLPPAN